MKDQADSDLHRELLGMQIIRNHFLNNVMEADPLTEVSNQISIRLQNIDDPIRLVMGNAAYGLEALSSATFFLGAAVNSLKALRLLTIQESKNAKGELEIQAHITVNGTAGLIRQIVECAARALWLTDSKLPEDISLRGYAALWANAEESVLFAKAIGSPELKTKEGLLSDLLEIGRSKNWINEGGRKPRPTVSLSGATEILMKVSFDSGPLKPALGIMGNNVENGEWVYRWLSGMAHGYVWVHPLQKVQSEESEVDLVWTEPDWVKLTLCITLAVHLIHLVMDSLQISITSGEVGDQA